MKRIILLIIFILILPLTLILTKLHFHKSLAQQFKVPSLSEQPRDTLVAEGALPIHHWKTNNGADVFFVPTEKLPMVDIYVTFDAGSARDGKLWGLASLCGCLLEEGCDKCDAEKIAETFENVGAQFNTKITRDRFIITLRSLTLPSSLEPTVDLLAQILSTPSFPEASLEQIKNQTLMELKRNKQEPSLIAAAGLYQELYPDHGYGHLVAGLQDTVASIKRDDLTSFHKQYFVGKNAIITIVGGIHRDQAQAISERLVAKLSEGNSPDPIPKIPELRKKEPLKIAYASSQTHMLMGQAFDFKDESEYYAVLVGNYILGEGPLVARLFKEIRNKRGLAYTVGSNVRRMLQGGLFITQLQTKSDQSREALAELKKVFQDFTENGPNSQELEEAKRGLIGAFPLSISNNGRIADVLAEITFYHLPLNYLNEYIPSIQAVTKENIQTAFKTHLNPDKMSLILVGENLP